MFLFLLLIDLLNLWLELELGLDESLPTTTFGVGYDSCLALKYLVHSSKLKLPA